MYSHVLIAVDSTEASVAAACSGIQALLRNPPAITVVHVLEPNEMPYSIELSFGTSNEHEVAERRRQRIEERLADLLLEHGLADVDLKVLIGHKVSTVQSMALELGCDLLVVASHGRQGFSRILGSTANALLHGCPCSVLIRSMRDHAD